jgi:hypothetical protein
MMQAVAVLYQDTFKGDFKLCYVDQDKDLRSITNQDDYSMALQEISKPNFMFKLKVDSGSQIVPVSKPASEPVSKPASKPASIPQMVLPQDNVESKYVVPGQEDQSNAIPAESVQIKIEPTQIVPPIPSQPEEKKKQEYGEYGYPVLGNPPVASTKVDIEIPILAQIPNTQTPVPNHPVVPIHQDEDLIPFPANMKITPFLQKEAAKLGPATMAQVDIEVLKPKKEPAKIETTDAININMQIPKEENKYWPEQKEKISEEEACISCNGKGYNEKHRKCKECKGTGKMNPLLLSKIQQIIAKQVEGEIIKQSGILEQSKRFENVLGSISQSAIISKEVKCSLCQKMIQLGECAYSCIICPEFFLCEKCEEDTDHPHNLVKGRCGGIGVPKANVGFDAEFMGESEIFGSVDPGAKLSKTWRIINTGKRAWPQDTTVSPCGGDDLQPVFSQIGPVKPNDSCDLVCNFVVPNRPGKFMQEFQLLASGRTFGRRKIQIEGVVESQMQDIPENLKEAFNSVKEIVGMNRTQSQILACLHKNNDNIEAAINELLQ